MSGDCEIAQYYTWKERVAIKPHGCCECTAKIQPGEKYLQVNAFWDNMPETYRQHLLCAQACMFVRDAGLNDDECIYFGGLKEWYSEWIEGGYNMETARDVRAALWRLMLNIFRREHKSAGKEGK